MSVVIPEPEMLTTCLDGNRPRERRQRVSGGSTPMDVLTRLPALVVLEHLPIPSIAIAHDGTILFANTAFARMVGYPQTGLGEMPLPQLFCSVPAAVCALATVETLTNLVVELQHCEGWTVRARMSKSALKRHDDPVVLVTFEDLTERLWAEGR
jgi:PAS domain S-box-containing protein